MEQDNTLDVLLAYGTDPLVLQEYDCVPLRVRLVRSVIKIRTPAGSRALKKVYMSDQRLDYVHQCTEYVAAGGLPNVPRFIHNRYGDPYVEHVSGLYYMTAWLPGREADLRKEAELLAAARTLARWQQTAAGFVPTDAWQPEQLPFGRRLEQSLAQLQEMQHKCRQQASQTPFEKLFLASSDELIERVKQAQEELELADMESAHEDAARRSLMCHGNFTKQNLIFDGENYNVVNYDSVYQGPPLYDLAFLIQRYLPAYEWNVDTLIRTVEAYHSVWGQSSSDQPRLAALLSAPLRSIQAVSWYQKRVKDWDEEDYIDYLETALELEEARDAARSVLSGSRLPSKAVAEVASLKVPDPDAPIAITPDIARAAMSSTEDDVEARVPTGPSPESLMPEFAALEVVDEESETQVLESIAEEDGIRLHIRSPHPRKAGVKSKTGQANGKVDEAKKKSVAPKPPGLRLWDADSGNDK